MLSHPKFSRPSFSLRASLTALVVATAAMFFGAFVAPASALAAQQDSAETDKSEKGETSKNSETSDKAEDDKGDAKKKADATSDDAKKKGDKDKGDKEKKAGDKDEKSKAKPDADAKSAKSEASKPATVAVKREKFRVNLELDGVVEAKNTTEVSIHPESWADFVVESAVAQGDRVKKGDTLIKFDATKLDEQIRDLEAGQKLAELGVEQTTHEVRLLEQATPLELKAAERAAQIAASDFQQFITQDRELAKKRADFSMKMYANYLEYQQEELRQLEKMYLADDLTEETEEIILKRTRDQVEQSQFSNEMAKIDREQLLNVQLPRREETLKEAVNRTALLLERSRATLPITLDKARLELERQKFDFERAGERLRRLQKDHDLMKIEAPAEGIVYYGQSQWGQWTTGSSVAARLRQGGRVSADEVVMTIVDPETVFVRATVPEKELWQVRRGLTGTAEPVGYDRTKLPASIDAFSAIPTPDGKYLATVLIDTARMPSELPPLAPGMSCKVKVSAYSNDDALTLPAKVVHTDKYDEDQRYVWVTGDDDKPVRRDISVGRQSGETIEITGGLEAGDMVLREAPKQDDE